MSNKVHPFNSSAEKYEVNNTTTSGVNNNNNMMYDKNKDNMTMHYNADVIGEVDIEERVELLAKANGCVFFYFSSSAIFASGILALILCAIFYKDKTNMRFNLGYMMKWDSKFDPVNNDNDFVILQLTWFLSLSFLMLLASWLLKHRPSLILKQDHIRMKSSRNRVLLIWLVGFALLSLSIIAQYHINKLTYMQEDRRRFCAFVYVSNTILLAVTRFMISHIDNEINDIVRFSSMFQVQTVVTIINSLSAFAMNHYYNKYIDGVPTFNNADDYKNYMKSIAMTGMEGFVLFWFASCTAQGLRVVHDICLTTSQAFAPRLIVKLFGTLSPQYLYGTREPFGIMLLGIAYTFGSSWTNPHIAWLGLIIVVSQFLSYKIRVALFLPNYQGIPSIIIYLLPNMLIFIAFVDVGLIAFFVVPMGKKFSLSVLMMTLFLIVGTYMMYFSHHTKQMSHLKSKERHHFIELNPVMTQNINKNFRKELVNAFSISNLNAYEETSPTNSHNAEVRRLSTAVKQQRRQSDLRRLSVVQIGRENVSKNRRDSAPQEVVGPDLESGNATGTSGA